MANFFKIFFTGTFLLLSLFNLTAQDTIVLVSGRKLPAKIVEITEKKVKYKNVRDTLGPTYVISRKDVERFIRQDGCFDIEEKGYQNCVKDPNFYVIKNENFTRRIISWEVPKIFFFRIAAGFDYIVRKRTWGLCFSGDYTLNDFDESDNYVKLKYDHGSPVYKVRNRMSGGFYRLNGVNAELKLYPYRHKKMVYWLGFGINSGQYGSRVSEQIHVSGKGSYNPTYSSYNLVVSNYSSNTGRYLYYKESYAGLYLTNGFIWRPSKHIAIQGYFSAGVDGVKLQELNNRVVSVIALNTGIKIGYAF